MKLLLVEDNKDDLVLLSSLLRKHGHEVLTAIDAEMALKILEANQIDAVIFDLRMPRISGMEFLAMLRADPRWANLPAVGRTALPAEDVPELIAGTPVVLVQKPHTVKELEKELASVCGVEKLPRTGGAAE